MDLVVLYRSGATTCGSLTRRVGASVGGIRSASFCSSSSRSAIDRPSFHLVCQNPTARKSLNMNGPVERLRGCFDIAPYETRKEGELEEVERSRQRAEVVEPERMTLQPHCHRKMGDHHIRSRPVWCARTRHQHLMSSGCSEACPLWSGHYWPDLSHEE